MIDVKPFFSKYEALALMVDGIFSRMENEYAELVTCKPGCSDCCYALFDLTLIEAMYINAKFNEHFSGVDNLNIIDRANTADRKIYKLKKNAHKESLDGVDPAEILGKMAAERVRCPLLNSDKNCSLYEYRPITCRLYGIPTASSGLSHTCGQSGFKEGTKYPTVDMDKLHARLYAISSEFVKSISTKYSKMADMLVPVSMALISDFDEDYLGIKPQGKE